MAELQSVSEASIDSATVTDMEAKKTELARVCSHILKNVFSTEQKVSHFSWSSQTVEFQDHPDFPLVLESLVQASLLLTDKTLFEHAISVNPRKLPCSFYCSLGSNLRSANFNWHREGYVCLCST